MQALAESNLLLARANEALTSRLEDHDSLKTSHATLRVENAALARELELVRADKTSLEQEMHLGALQRSTRRVKVYVSLVPFACGFLGFLTALVMLVIAMMGLVHVTLYILVAVGMLPALVMFLSIKPTDDALIRYFSGFGPSGGPMFATFFAALAFIFFPPTGLCPISNNATAQQIAGGNDGEDEAARE